MEKTTRRLPIVERDEWLLPAEQELNRRYERYTDKINAIEQAAGSIVDYANGYRYFGWQRDELLDGWWLREWLPGAHDVYVFGDFNNWQRTEIRMQRDAHGVWSAFFPEAMYRDRLRHGSLYKLHVHGDNGWKDRIPAYATRVVQDEATKNYTAQFWAPEPFDWQGDAFDASKNGSLMIYEAHVGMAQEKEGVGTYREFTEKILPIIKKDGYNAVQLMAIAEHPYYGSFGYHVSSFFAPASRCGTPEELKELVRRAHELGLAVIMDLVHAHYVRNLNEGIDELDGTDHLYSLPGKAGYQPYWDSKLFDYGKDEVQHFLLSNVKYWLDEFHFDGYRFDGVTSMIYHHHGYVDFDCRERFFDEGVNRDALTYLTLANRLVHDFRPAAVTIAEDVSGMPGMCIPIADGGIGFDYRLGMAIPDFWIKELKEVPDEEWNIWEMWDVMTNRLPEVKTVAYAESHDQALVGDKTLAFRLMDKEMYFHMDKASENIVIDRGMALHKMIRLMTISTGGQAYLNFMGNEFRTPRVDRLPARRQRLELCPRPAAMVAGEERVPALLVAGGFRQGDDKAGEALQGTRGRLCLEPRDGRVQQDDGFLARQPAVRVQLAPHGLDPRLRTARAGAGQVCARALDRRKALRRATAAGDGRRAFLVPGTRRRQHRTAPYPHLQHLAHGDGLPAEEIAAGASSAPTKTSRRQQQQACPMRGQACCFILGQGRPSPAGKGRHPVSQPRLPAKRRAFGPRRSRPEAVCRPQKAGCGQGCNACRSQMAGLGRATALVGRERRPPDGGERFPDGQALHLYGNLSAG